MQIHNTKAVVLRVVKYGETSVIVTMYTELFGLQSFIVKGVRKESKKSQLVNYYHPGALLQLQVYHNELKHLQFIKDAQWYYMYKEVFFSVLKNAVAMYIIELCQQSLKEPENNPDVYHCIEEALIQLDKNSESFAANLPLYFTLRLSTELGFQIHGKYTDATAVLDLQAGRFLSSTPQHVDYIENNLARITSEFMSITFYSDIENIKLNKNMRRDLLAAYQVYMQYHITGFNQLKSLEVLQELF